MNWLLDTHVVLWAMVSPERLPADVSQALRDPDRPVCFSAASIWEIAIKASSGREDFTVTPGAVWDTANIMGWNELPVTAVYAARAATLPPLHRDPFDRLLVAQALVEGLTLVTSNQALANYPGTIRLI